MDRYVKNNHLAKQLRQEANKLYQDKQYYDALVKYNESLCNAVEGSEDMAFAYANRSAVYFELGYHDKVVSNIQKALRNSYPEEKKKTILERKERSEKLLIEIKKEDETDPSDFFKLSYNPNPKYPSFAECIELRTNEKFGRYLITNRDLNVGDIIAIEDFFYYSTYKSDGNYNSPTKMFKNANGFQMCAFCLKSNLLDLEPCKNCDATMYCSEQCCKDDLQRVHSLECHTMTSLMAMKSLHNTFNSFFTALSVCNGSIDELEELIKEAESFRKPITIFDFDFSSMNETEMKKKLIQILYHGHYKKYDRNKTNVLKDLITMFFSHHPITAILFKAHQKFIINFITRLEEIENLNCFALNKEIPKFGENTVCAGAGLCPGLILLNHSCVPNVVRIHVGTKFALIVIRSIKKNEQLFDCYTKDFMSQSKTMRHQTLKYRGFDCKCYACKKNLPVYEECLNKGSLSHYATTNNDMMWKLHDEGKMTIELAKKYLLEYYGVLNKKSKSDWYSCDYAEIVQCIVMCLLVVSANQKLIP